MTPASILRAASLTGGIFGLAAVALGAVADHVLRPVVPAGDFANLQIAVRYALIHAGLLCGLGLTRFVTIPPQTMRLLALAAGCFGTGIALFSGGIYAGIALQTPPLLHLAPIGGISLMLGWLVLAASAVFA